MVWSNFVAGIIPLSDIKEGFKFMAEHGIVPGANIYHAEVGSSIGKSMGTIDENYIRDLYSYAAELYHKFGYKPYFDAAVLRNSLANEFFNQTDLLNRIPIECTWWIGISLGASVLWTLSSLVESRSIRLTVINPFADRERLSREKGFNLRGQWNFKPIDFQSVAEHIDVVVSIYEKVKIRSSNKQFGSTD